MSPYEILGVPPGASDEEIKQAYRQKALYFSGGNYSANLDGAAKEKMAELDRAYDTVMLERTNSTQRASQSAAGQKRQQFDHTASGTNAQFGDIRAKIHTGRLDDAETLLDGVPKAKRTAEWYFLKGTIFHRRGWFEEAARNYNTAYGMEPDNQEYKEARDRCEYNRKGMYDKDYNTGGCCGCGPCSICTGLLAADCCCDCMRCC